MQHINLEQFAGGAFTAQINRELKKVAENIQDPNTDATAKRKITVVMEFKPNEARDFVTTGVQAKATLAPALGAVTAFNVGTDLKTGEVQAAEIGKQLPGRWLWCWKTQTKRKTPWFEQWIHPPERFMRHRPAT